ncbi:MAG: hypothetical protein ACTS6A_01010 [Candidatus Hodgkinia cicadicola]
MFSIKHFHLRRSNFYFVSSKETSHRPLISFVQLVAHQAAGSHFFGKSFFQTFYQLYLNTFAGAERFASIKIHQSSGGSYLRVKLY